jgi:hypothetical protein
MNLCISTAIFPTTNSLNSVNVEWMAVWMSYKWRMSVTLYSMYKMNIKY